MCASGAKARKASKKDVKAIDVSVIIPCYNAQTYLKQALTSALKSKRVTCEFIVVNDGSTDKSPVIAEKIAKRDGRVRVLTKKNGGYGSAMNAGIAAAKGRYIGILEPDDWVAPQTFDELFEFAKTYADASHAKGEDAWPDIVKSAYWRVVNPDTPKEARYLCAYAHRVDPPNQPFTLVQEPRLVKHHPSIWSALYKTSFLREQDIAFKELPGAGWVDNPFLFETMLSASQIVYLDQPFYYYREDLPGSSSATKTAKLGLDRWLDMHAVCEAHNVTDAGVLSSLYTIAARYVFDAVDKGALDDPKLAKQIDEIASKIDLEVLQDMDNLSPHVKHFFFEHAGKEHKKFKRKSYYKNLAKEFRYARKTNGLAFALSRIGLFKNRKKVEKAGSSHKA